MQLACFHLAVPTHSHAATMVAMSAQELLCDQKLDNTQITSELQAAASDTGSTDKLLNSEAARNALAARLAQVPRCAAPQIDGHALSPA